MPAVDYSHDVWIVWFVAENDKRFYAGTYATEIAAFRAVDVLKASTYGGMFEKLMITRELAVAW